MKLRRTKTGTYTITGITATQYRALAAVLMTADERCFDEQDEDGNYYSNDDFVCSLDAMNARHCDRCATHFDNV
nr:MAG TPA: hypothetical protein [Caudoviricetes sp.]